MALRIELKPNERILIGDCIITNDDQRTRFLVEGRVPILREKDIMTVDRAVTPATRIYLAIQLMYTARDPRPHHETYFSLMNDLLQAAPSTGRYVEIINNHILTGELYKALKKAQELITYEQELLSNAESGASLRKGRKADLQSA